MKKSIFFVALSFLLVLSCKKDSLLENVQQHSASTAGGMDAGLAEVTEREGLNDYALTTSGVTYPRWFKSPDLNLLSARHPAGSSPRWHQVFPPYAGSSLRT